MNPYYDVDDMMLAMCAAAIDGRASRTRGDATFETHGWTGSLVNPRRRLVSSPYRNLKTGYAAASCAWNLGLRDDVDSICRWNEAGRRISDDGERFYGANYGQRIQSNLRVAMQLLEHDAGTRRAWVPVWDSSDLFDELMPPGVPPFYSRDGKDVPCTLGFSLWKEDGLLFMEVVMRSQSAWGVFPYDVYLFSVLQELIANELRIGLGSLLWHCISLHVYEREMEAILKGLASLDSYHAEEMRPIRRTLGDAESRWPQLFQDLTFPGDNGIPFHRDTMDPVELQMLLGRP